MRVVGYVAVALVAGAVIGAVVTGANSAGDIKRYVRMRRM
jgi:hypothetical protein